MRFSLASATVLNNASRPHSTEFSSLFAQSLEFRPGDDWTVETALSYPLYCDLVLKGPYPLVGESELSALATPTFIFCMLLFTKITKLTMQNWTKSFPLYINSKLWLEFTMLLETHFYETSLRKTSTD
jgi:hypothetical protein